MTSFLLPFPDCIICFALGAGIALLYLFLLSLTLKYLAQCKHKGIVLFISTLIRFALLLFLLFYFSNNDRTRLLWMMIAFILIYYSTVFFVSKRGGHK